MDKQEQRNKASNDSLEQKLITPHMNSLLSKIPLFPTLKRA